MLSPPTVWRQQSEFVSSRQSGQIPAAVRIGFVCCCNGQNISNRSLDTHVRLNVATRFCVVYPDKCWFAVLCRFWLHCSRSLKVGLLQIQTRTFACNLGSVTDNPGSKPDQKYARRRDRQNYIQKNKVKFMAWNKRIPLCLQYIHW